MSTKKTTKKVRKCWIDFSHKVSYYGTKKVPFIDDVLGEGGSYGHLENIP